MGRLILLFVPLLVLCFFGGLAVGRAGKKRAVSQATSNIRPLVAAVRQLDGIDFLGSPADANYRIQNVQLALDTYDDDQRRALT